MSEAAKAAKYEALYPDAVTDEGQKAERWDRLTFKEERQSGSRTSRQRGIVVPEIPWRAER